MRLNLSLRGEHKRLFSKAHRQIFYILSDASMEIAHAVRTGNTKRHYCAEIEHQHALSGCFKLSLKSGLRVVHSQRLLQMTAEAMLGPPLGRRNSDGLSNELPNDRKQPIEKEL